MAGAQDHLDDAALLHAHAAGDPDAFGELVRRHRDRLWAVALRTLGDREEAADAVQDALVSAYRAADRFRGDSAVTTWLHRIVVNACLDRARRRQSRLTVAMPEVETPATAKAPPDSDTALTVRAALAKLPDEQRVPILLLDVQGYSVAEISTLLGVAEGTVKSRCARGRARLAVMLADLRSGGAQSSGAAHAQLSTQVGNPAPPGDVGSAEGVGRGGVS